MIYIKSILVGVVALFSAAIVYLVILIAVLMRRYPPPPGAEVSLDLRSVTNHEPSFWVVALLAFAFGFYWEFRRASR
jgi:H+/Cl- antiporter ClcA